MRIGHIPDALDRGAGRVAAVKRDAWRAPVAALAVLTFAAQCAVALLDEPLLDSGLPIEVDAGRIEYDQTAGRLLADGHALVRQGHDELRAEQIRIDMRTRIAHASGAVVLTRPSGEVRADALVYDFRNRTASLETVYVETDPFFVHAATAGLVDGNRYLMTDACITTCEHDRDRWHYHVRARRIQVLPGESFTASHPVWYLGGVPFLYLPYWRRNLDSERGFHFRPGYSSRWGGYLLTSYRHPLGNHVRLEHQIDSRSRRGLAVGELARWNTARQYGDLHLYFADDRNPEIGREQARADLDNQRYRARLRHRADHRPDTYSLLQVETTGDAFMRQDFFEREYRRSPQPENFYMVTHRGDEFTLSALARYRVDPFYNHVNRLPEIAFDVMRIQLGDSSFYYESRSAAAWLERLWARPAEREPYSTVRADSAHVLYQPRQYMGWLNLTPRVGYRGTAYADSIRMDTRMEIETIVRTNTLVGADGSMAPEIVTVATTNSVPFVRAGGSVYRSVLSGGAEVSYKAYRVLREDGPGLRHLAEPYLNYTYVMEPDVLPEELLQFDSVDTVRAAHFTRVGIRNKLQTRRDDAVFDLLDLNVYGDLRMNPSRTERVIDYLLFELEAWPAPSLQFKTDGRYNLDAREVDRLNSRILYRHDPAFDLTLEHRYALNAVDLLTTAATVRPRSGWAFTAFARHSFETSRTEEQGFNVQRNLDCMVIRAGMSMQPGFTRTDGTQRNDEYRFLIELWLTAFPEQGMTARSSYHAGD